MNIHTNLFEQKQVDLIVYLEKKVKEYLYEDIPNCECHIYNLMASIIERKKYELTPRDYFNFYEFLENHHIYYEKDSIVIISFFDENKNLWKKYAHPNQFGRHVNNFLERPMKEIFINYYLTKLKSIKFEDINIFFLDNLRWKIIDMLKGEKYKSFITEIASVPQKKLKRKLTKNNDLRKEFRAFCNKFISGIEKNSNINYTCKLSQIESWFLSNYELYDNKNEELFLNINKIDSTSFCFPVSQKYEDNEIGYIRGNFVFNVKTMEYEQRRLDHYFTYSLERKYIKYTEEEKKQENNPYFLVTEMIKKYFLYKNENQEWVLDEEQYKCFRQCIAYSLTNETFFKKFFVIIGDTNTGKSSLFALIDNCFNNGNIVSPCSNKIIVHSKSNSHIKSELQKLDVGCRLVYCSEFNNDEKLNSNQMKSLTGNDKIVYRPFGKSEVEFINKSKIWIFTNEMVQYDIYDEAVNDRLLYFNFRYDFAKNSTKRDKMIYEKINKEFKDVTFTMLMDWIHEFIQGDCKIDEPTNMVDFKKEMKEEKNPMEEFFSCFNITNNPETIKSYLSKSPKERKDHLLNNDFLTKYQIADHYRDFCRVKGMFIPTEDKIRNLYKLLPTCLSNHYSSEKLIRVGNKNDKKFYGYNFLM